MTTEEKKVVGKECRFAIHIPTKSHDVPDMHLVKEILHYEDGTTKPNVAFIRDQQRPYAVTKTSARNHEQKKESERLDNLVIHQCTQSELTKRVARALGNPYDPRPLNKLAASPYLYGTDISSTSVIKHNYTKTWPAFNTPYSVSHLDIETDMLHGTEDPIMISVMFGKKLFFSVVGSFVEGYTDVEGQYRACVKKYIQEYIDKHEIEIEFYLAPDCVTMLREAIGRLHQWLPDFVAVWNIGFDVPRMLKTLEKYNVNAEEVFCHPGLKEGRRFLKYREGSTKKITASGQFKPKKPSEQWHSLINSAGFWFIDQMSSYRFVRQGAQELAEYSLDFVLQEVLGIRKLKFEEAEGYFKGEWHKFMQKNYPFEYMVYNNFDSISCHELELKTQDLGLSVPIRTGISDFTRFDSQTKRFSDKYHYFLLDKKGEMVGTIPPKENARPGDEEHVDYIGDFGDEDDDVDPNADESTLEYAMENKDDVLSLRDWIVTLKPYLSVLGLTIVEENALLRTLIRCMTYDSDAVSAYPSAAAVANVSKATTLYELIAILGIDEDVFRQQNINLLQGHVNAVEYSVKMFGLPSIEDSLSVFADM